MGNNRYLLFAGNDYYPDGGGWDFQASYKSIQEAINSHEPYFKYDGGWANVFDTEKEIVVKEFSRGIWYNPGENPNSPGYGTTNEFST